MQLRFARRFGVIGAAASLVLAIPVLAGLPALRAQPTGPMAAHHGAMPAALPTQPGQGAFGAIQEIVAILDADPKTDWSKVDLEALRQHLIDMNEVTLKAAASVKPVAGGIAVAVTGRGRTLGAIRRLVPAHAAEIEETHLNGWSASTAPLSDGVLLTVTAKDPKEVAHLRGLGFIGVMASGAHHQRHHLMVARGEMMHDAAGTGGQAAMPPMPSGPDPSDMHMQMHMQMTPEHGDAAPGGAAGDSRALVRLPAPMQAHMLANMRDHLASLNEVIGDLGEDKFDAAADVAEARLGMSSLGLHDAAAMAPFMPKPMQEAGTSLHRSASRLAIVIKDASVTRDAEARRKVDAALHEVTAACAACHASYRIR